ncbi:uncharacterized protein LOC119291042 isoform X1 [Triticum dicoccoides]|uniref:uncharacterized protein LOC119291042 isoform X1 n=1 Tax=Triticum dicoccoides TaxID=85692 RepID=UPI000E788574|nr:uncharacterized protein LOC119291042 isoform X1 [Triticum dicoccoides]
MGTRAATSAPVAAVSSILFGRSLPQTLLLTTAHCWGFPPWMRRRTTSAAWRSSSGCFLERSREMGSSPNAGAAVLPDGLHPAVLGCISWWWHGFIERSYKYREQHTVSHGNELNELLSTAAVQHAGGLSSPHQLPQQLPIQLFCDTAQSVMASLTV